MTGSVYYLRDGVVIKELYRDKDLSDEQLKAIEKASKDGFTEEELKKLEEENIDTSLIKNESQLKEEKTTITTGKKSTDDVNKKAEELKEKYCKNLDDFNGDVYSAENPQLQALNDALEDSVILLLGKEGFNKTQIVQIIEKAFPDVKIKSTSDDGSYDRPKGHGKEAQEIYSRFTAHLLSATGDLETDEIKDKKKELAKINSKIGLNNQELQILEVTIEALQQEVEEQLNKAIEESKDIQEEHKQKAKDCLKNRLEDYKSSNGKMTYEEFKENISSDLSGFQTSSNRKLNDVVCDMLDANRKMGLLKDYVIKIGELSTENLKLANDAKEVKNSLNELIDKAKQDAANSNNTDSQANLTDPIGFYSENKRFDFFIDKDKNNDITNETEFLGAKDGFNEVKKLDENNDGLVSAGELNSANIKIIQTNEFGEQEILDVSNVFKNVTDGINLNTYKETHQDIGDNNTLLGTFNVNLDGTTQSGYQTLDTHDWLDKNYEFTDEQAGIGRFAQDYVGDAEAYSVDESKINIFEQKNEELTTKLNQALSAWGIDKDILELQTKSLSDEFKKAGDVVSDKFKKIAKEEEELEEWSKEEMKEDEKKFKEKYKEEEKEKTLGNNNIANDAKTVLERAKGELGMKEVGGNNRGPITKYGGASGDPWCASFVSWCYKGSPLKYSASVDGLRNQASKAGYYSKVGTYTPKPGDIMIQKSNGASHTGIVTGFDGEYVYTIEGNADNAVKEKKYKIGSSGYAKISGWIRMNDWLEAQ